jgi:hypothetical protein
VTLPNGSVNNDHILVEPGHQHGSGVAEGTCQRNRHCSGLRSPGGPEHAWKRPARVWSMALPKLDPLQSGIANGSRRTQKSRLIRCRWTGRHATPGPGRKSDSPAAGRLRPVSVQRQGPVVTTSGPEQTGHLSNRHWPASSLVNASKCSLWRLDSLPITRSTSTRFWYRI